MRNKGKVLILILILICSIVSVFILFFIVSTCEAEDSVTKAIAYINEYSITQDTSEILSTENEENDMYSTEIISLDESSLILSYDKKPQGELFDIPNNSWGIYSGELPELCDDTFTVLSENLRFDVVYVLDRYVEKNNIKGVFSLYKTQVGQPTSKRKTFKVYTDEVEYYITLDYDTMEAGVTTNYVQE